MIKLSPAQKKMLTTAAKTRKARAFAQTGQASTAKKLNELGLGGYVNDGYSGRFYLWNAGLDVARELDPSGVAWGEGLRIRHGEHPTDLDLLDR